MEIKSHGLTCFSWKKIQRLICGFSRLQGLTCNLSSTEKFSVIWIKNTDNYLHTCFEEDQQWKAEGFPHMPTPKRSKLREQNYEREETNTLDKASMNSNTCITEKSTERM